jgi:hypothetical protein
MTATSQHGFHPDAESLSAFSEQALGERERADVLAHLAVCGRCRQVVALARGAADTDVAAATAPPRKTVEPTAWWKQWRFVWVPAAVAVAFAVTTISVLIEHADRHGPDVKIAEQNPTPSTAPPATSSPTEQPEAVPPTAAIPAPPPAHAAKHAPPATPEPMPAPAPPAVAAQMPPEPGAPETRAIDQAEVTREAQPLSHAEAQQAPPGLPAGTMGSSYTQPAAAAWETEQKQAEQQRQADVDTSHMRVLKHKAAPAAAHGANQPAPAGATQTDTVASAPPLQTQPVTFAEPAPASASNSLWEVTGPVKPTPLPSGLAAVSIASGGHFLLAIDKAGALFLSKDRGATWERVATQWTGRAVAVRRQAHVHGALYAAPAAPTGTTGGSSPDAGLAPLPTEFFELSNDKNQTWVSTDGRTWTAN